jgi:hypothetical protein
MKRLFFAILIPAFVLIALFSRPAANPALACSGPGPTLDGTLEWADVVVYGRIIEIDDVGQNAVFAVESYLGGQGAAYLLVQQNNPRDTYGLLYGLIGGRLQPPATYVFRGSEGRGLKGILGTHEQAKYTTT